MENNQQDNKWTAFFMRGMLVLSALLVALGFVAGQWVTVGTEWVLFLGRFHPVILHLPIGLFCGLLILVLLNVFSKSKASTFACDVLLGLTTVSASLAAGAGFCLATEGGYSADLLYDHKLLGTLFTLAILVAALLRSRGVIAGRRSHGVLELIALFVAAGTMVITGHHGGSLTHGSTYLTDYAPDWLPLAAEGSTSEESDGFAGDSAQVHSVMEIFEANCFKCHGAEKQKGDYRMDDSDVLFAGGESGLAAIVPGSAMESYLAEVITLPRHDEYAMPPEGKAQLSDSEIIQVLHWINEGAELQGMPTVSAELASVDVPVEAVEPEPVLAELTPSVATPAGPEVFLASGDLGSDLDYITHVQPLFEEYCIRCHGPDKQKAKVRIDTLNPDMLNGIDGDGWAHVLDVINSGEMPEEDEKQPTAEERRTMVSWLTDELYEATELKKGTIAPVIRRLNKDQYTNTLQELLGVDVDFGKNLPPEALSEEGFQNNGEVLGMSSLLVEYYIQIARQALKKAIVTEAPPEVHHFKVSFGKDIREKGGRFGLGYKSASLPYKDFFTEALPIEDKTFDVEAFKFGVSSPYNVKNKKSSIDDVFYVDFRGSSKDRYSVLKDGISMASALPHVEKNASKWHGPSPNLKVVMRDFPTAGDFVMRVEASRAEALSIPSSFIYYSDQKPLVSYSQLSGLNAEDSAIILDAMQPFEDNRLSFQQDYVHFNGSGTGAARARYKFDTSIKRGFYQLDVVFASAESRPIDIKIDNNELKGVLTQKTGGWQVADLKAYSVGVVQLNKGKHDIQFTRGDGPIPHINSLVLTPIESTKEIAAAMRSGGAIDAKAGEYPYLRAFMGSRTDDGMEYRTFDESKPLKGAFGQRETLEFRGRLENLPLPAIDQNDTTPLANMALIGLWNDALAPSYNKQANPVTVHSIEFEGPYLESWPTQSHQQIFIDSLNRSNRPVYAREILSHFMSKAYRRRATDQEIDRIWNFWNETYPTAESFEHSIQESLIIVLCSPNFLYLVEPDQEAGALSDFELASRLSYFLWNGMPDDELFHLAANGQLRDQLDEQVARMLKDDRAWSFIDSFTKQWLDVASIDRVEISVDLYPNYNRFVKSDMVEETLHFVREVLINDLPILNFVDSDFVMLNQNLAQFYGIDGVKGSEFRRVRVDKELQRGGLISQGSFLAGHSAGDDSHPIKRGVWLIEKILDDPPPPAPPNVPEIDRENPDLIKLSMKEQLEIHRDRDSCRDCHKKIDPWGVAFEGYDAVGLLRDRVRKQDSDGKFYEVDFMTSSELEDGSQLDGIADLKQYLAEQREADVLRAVTKHLLSYAIGRSLTFADEEMIDQLVAQSEADGGKMQSLLKSVISSPLFLNR